MLRALELIADAEDATDDGRPAAELRPERGACWVGGDRELVFC